MLSYIVPRRDMPVNADQIENRIIAVESQNKGG